MATRQQERRYVHSGDFEPIHSAGTANFLPESSHRSPAIGQRPEERRSKRCATAFQSLAVLGEGGPFANSEPFSKSSRAEAFNAVGEAIAAGNLAGAQAAFATLIGKQSTSSNSASAEAATVNLSNTEAAGAAPADSQSSIYLQLQT